MMDLICREMSRKGLKKLSERILIIEKKMKLMVRFTLRRSKQNFEDFKKITEDLGGINTILDTHTRTITSIGRTLTMLKDLAQIFSGKFESIEKDMDDNSTDCAAMWERLRLQESLIDGLQNKVDALEKIGTTKIAAFVYGSGCSDKLTSRLEDLEKLHSTQIDGAAVNQGPPRRKEGTHEEGN